MTQIYSGVEPLTESILDVPILLLSGGTGWHYFLLLVRGGKCYKLDWGPSTSSNFGEVRFVVQDFVLHEVQDQDSVLHEVQNRYLGKVKETPRAIFLKAKKQWKGQRYNAISNNCIKFAESVCSSHGIVYSHPFLDCRMLSNKHKSIAPFHIGAIIFSLLCAFA